MDWLSSSLPFLKSLHQLTFLTAPAKFFSVLGKEEFFLLLLPLIYWCIDRSKGARLGVLFLFSTAINEILKVGLAWPRPYWFDPSLGRAVEDTFGFPSGHAQHATVVWIFLAFQSKRPKAWVPLAFLLAFAIAFSRLCLGVHFPADVIGGALIGFLILGLANWGEARWMAFWREISLPQKVFLAALLVLMLSGFYFVAVFLGPQKMTEGYANVAPAATPALQEALSGHNISSQLGSLFGLLVGFAATARYLSFSAQVSVPRKVLRFLIGLVGLAVFYFGLKLVLPDEVPLRFLRYALTTFWIGFGAPWVFGKSERNSVPRALAV